MVNIGLPIIEINRRDTDAVGKIRCEVNRHPAFEELWIGNEGMLSLARLEIYLGRRKVYHEGEKIELMAKEFDLLCLLVVNKGYVLTYAQIYEKIWGENSFGDESISVGYHTRSLRRKLCQEYPDAPFTIRCLRSIGYCLELDSN